jgi:hypothetical protein
MNRLEEARHRMRAIRQACREGRDPAIDAEALRMLREAVGTDALRVWQLAELLIVEAYMAALSDVDAAKVVVDAWTKTTAWALSVSGKPMIPLADIGMYPGPEPDE